jgi:hypothetical protein
LSEVVIQARPTDEAGGNLKNYGEIVGFRNRADGDRWDVLVPGLAAQLPVDSRHRLSTVLGVILIKGGNHKLVVALGGARPDAAAVQVGYIRGGGYKNRARSTTATALAQQHIHNPRASLPFKPPSMILALASFHLLFYYIPFQADIDSFMATYAASHPNVRSGVRVRYLELEDPFSRTAGSLDVDALPLASLAGDVEESAIAQAFKNK